MSLSTIARCAIIGVAALAGLARTAAANEIWIAPTYQHDLGGVGIAIHTWPVTTLGQVRFVFAVPEDFLRLTGAKLVLVPQTTATNGDLTLVICRARDAEFVGGQCAQPAPLRFRANADYVVEVDIRGELERQLGPPGVTYMSVMATTSPNTKTDHFLGLRLAYDAGLPTLGSNTFTGTQTISSGDLNLGTSGSIVQNGGLLVHTSGTNNTYLGRGAGQTFPGSDNTGIGAMALNRNVLSRNTAVGSGALQNDFFGSENTAVGAESLPGTGSGNTFRANTSVGYRALVALDRGTGNIAIGYQAGSTVTLGFNNIYIGHVGAPIESSTMRLGTSLSRVFISGIWNAATGDPTTMPVVIDQYGQLGTISSSRRYKDDIRDMGTASQRLLALRPVTFRYKQPNSPIEYGLVAEEVAEAFPELVVYDADGRPQTVKYHTLNVLLLNEFQAQQRRLDALERELAALRTSRR